ncbi:unnamed protein product [Cyprideis torosa]|uniref:Uncharacterized protein n=1 Tax=Cyprideis torosa TaxID=163714 RepID=A0A7R8W637_9CRUS|nr:unnamed protein product [Cyprideis torosa]CAG0884819.1 unnamed protein product [Cyprideis torosa]
MEELDPNFGQELCSTSKAIVRKVLAHPLIQRLKRIKQLGTLSLIHPEIKHTRFEHSEGVMRWATFFVCRLRQTWELYSPAPCPITEEDMLLVVLAGLCHDLGHGPLSHTWEAVTKRIQPGCPLKHNDISADLMTEVFSGTMLENDVPLMQELVKDEPHVKWICNGLPLVLTTIVNNQISGFDVDKIDYLIRDGSAFGCPSFFAIRMKELLSSARVFEGKFIRFPLSKAVDVVRVFATRYVFHVVHYQSPDVVISEEMLIEGLSGIADHPVPNRNVELLKAVRHPQFMEWLDDEMLEVLRNESKQEAEDGGSCYADLYDRVTSRRLYPHLVTLSWESDNVEVSGSQDEMKQELVNDLREIEGLAVVSSAPGFGNGKRDPLERMEFFDDKEEGKKNGPPRPEVIRVGFNEVMPLQLHRSVFQESLLLLADKETRPLDDIKDDLLKVLNKFLPYGRILLRKVVNEKFSASLLTDLSLAFKEYPSKEDKELIKFLKRGEGTRSPRLDVTIPAGRSCSHASAGSDVLREAISCGKRCPAGSDILREAMSCGKRCPAECVKTSAGSVAGNRWRGTATAPCWKFKWTHVNKLTLVWKMFVFAADVSKQQNLLKRVVWSQNAFRWWMAEKR